jgi:hypothetical protein
MSQAEIVPKPDMVYVQSHTLLLHAANQKEDKSERVSSSQQQMLGEKKIKLLFYAVNRFARLQRVPAMEKSTVHKKAEKRSRK